MGKMLVLDVAITDTTAPKLAKIDPIESSGSLLLIEPAHPTQTTALGALVNGLVVPNLFAANAKSIIGVTDSMDSVLNVASGLSGKLALERTTKGGIHGAVTKTAGAITSGLGVLLNAALALRNFSGFKKATGHDIYYSAWVRNTRVSSGNNTVTVEHGSAANAEQSALFRRDAIVAGDGSTPAAYISTNPGAGAAGLGNFRRSIAVSVANSSLDATANVFGPEWGAMTNTYMNAVPAWRDDAPSFILYRLYVEDLTISGRSYATVDALDAAQYSAAFGAGGRYAGDTFTDAATLVP